MPESGELDVQARLPLPDAIERGVDNLLRCPLYDDGALVAPASGTVSVYDPNGTAVVDGAAVTIASSVATYTYTAPATLELGEGYRVEWSLVVSGDTIAPRNAAAVVRRRLRCPITDVDLFRYAPMLNPSGSDPLTSRADFDEPITEAWTSISLRLFELGNRPNLIIDPSALRMVAIHTTLALVFGAMVHPGSDGYATLAAEQRDLAEAAWRRVRLRYDATDDGVADPGRRAARRAVLWFGRGR